MGERARKKDYRIAKPIKMSEIFQIGSIPVKTNHPGDFYKHFENIKQKVNEGFFCGSIDGYWWVIPLSFRK